MGRERRREVQLPARLIRRRRASGRRQSSRAAAIPESVLPGVSEWLDQLEQAGVTYCETPECRVGPSAWLRPAERRPPAGCPTDPPRRSIKHWVASGAGLHGEEPVAQLGIVVVAVEDGVGEVRFGHTASLTGWRGHRWSGWRAISRTRHLTVTGIPSAASSRTSGYICSRQVGLRHSSNRVRFFAARRSAFSAAVVPGSTPSSTSAAVSQFVRHDSEIPGSLAMYFDPHTRFTVAGDADPAPDPRGGRPPRARRPARGRCGRALRLGGPNRSRRCTTMTTVSFTIAHTMAMSCWPVGTRTGHSGARTSAPAHPACARVAQRMRPARGQTR